EVARGLVLLGGLGDLVVLGRRNGPRRGFCVALGAIVGGVGGFVLVDLEFVTGFGFEFVGGLEPALGEFIGGGSALGRGGLLRSAAGAGVPRLGGCGLGGLGRRAPLHRGAGLRLRRPRSGFGSPLGGRRSVRGLLGG